MEAALQALIDVGLPLELALQHPWDELSHRLACAGQEVGDDEAADGQPVHQHAGEIAGPGGPVGVVVGRDHAAHRHATVHIHQRQRRIQLRPAGVAPTAAEVYPAFARDALGWQARFTDVRDSIATAWAWMNSTVSPTLALSAICLILLKLHLIPFPS